MSALHASLPGTYNVDSHGSVTVGAERKYDPKKIDPQGRPASSRSNIQVNGVTKRR
ncbi:MAG: hypothetical protein QXF82_07970 [Nitrososphaeria archaeon]